MRMNASGSWLVFSLLAGTAAGQLPLGPEQQANSYTAGEQQNPRVAADPASGFLVAWSDQAGELVQLRRFDGTGAPVGPEFQVDDDGYSYAQRWPTKVLVDDDSEFTVVWGTYEGGPGCFCPGGNARRFGSDGAPMGSGFVVASMQRYGITPVAVGRPSGDFVVATMESAPIDLTRYSSTGAVQGQSSIVAEPNHDHASPSLAIAPTGEFVVAWNDWERAAQYPHELLWDRILLQQFGAAGEPAGPRIEVTAPESEGYRSSPRVARSAAGSFLVVWSENPAEVGGPEEQLLFARAYDAQGAPLGEPVQVHELTAGAQLGPTVAAAGDGSFVVAWTDRLEDGEGGDGSGSGARARQLTADGLPTSASFLVNSYTTGDQHYPSLTFLPDGDFLVAWSSEGSFGDDASGESIQIRRFRLAFFADGFESGDASRWSAVGG